MSDDVVSAVERYHAMNWATVPVHFQTKRPVSNSWQQATSKEAALRAFKSGRLNVGVLLGAPSGGLIDIDLDCSEALTLAPAFLPPTTTFGRFSNRASHWLYQVSGTLDTKGFKDPTRPKNEAMIVEIRSTGAQTVFPPSIHESGEAIAFTQPITDAFQPTVISADVLQHAVARLAAAVMVVRNWPTGARHEASMALAGGLSRCGLTDDETLAFLDAVVKNTDDDEGPDRLRAARDTLKKLHAGRKKVSGFPVLAESMGEDAVEAIRNFLVDGDDPDLVKRINDEFKFIFMGSGTVIAHVIDDPALKRKRIDYLSISSFKERTMDRYVTIGRGDAIKTTKMANYWLNTPNVHPTYIATTFQPRGVVAPNIYNTWRGFACEPDPNGDWSIFRDHVLNNIANGNQEHFNWIMSFLAQAIQQPEIKPPVALVIRGGEGTGKTNFAKVVTGLVPEHSVDIYSSHQLVGKFNGHMQDCLFMTANEAFFAGDKQHESVLKSLITDQYLMIERKGKDAVQMPNYMRLIMTSNENWVVPAAYDSRRFAVFTIGERNKNDKPFFKAMFDQLDKGGREGLLHFLLTHPYDHEFAFKLPQTNALAQQRELSRSPVETWWVNRLEEAVPCPSAGSWANIGRNGVDTWPELVAKPALYEDFRNSQGRTARYERESTFWAEFYKLVPEECKGRGTLHRVMRPMYSQAEGPTSKSMRVAFMKLPCLVDARAAYCELRNKKIDWPEIVDEPERKAEY